MKKLVIILIIFAILLIIVASVFLWFRAKNTKGVEIELITPELIQSGVPFDLVVNIANDSKVVLKDSHLIVTLPEDFVFVNQGATDSLSSHKIGDLGEKTITKEPFKVIPLGGENRISTLKAEFSYTPGSIKSRFEKVTTRDVIVSDSGISVDLSNPTKVLSGEEFETLVIFKNLAEIEFGDTDLKVTFPSEYKFISSSEETFEQEDNVFTWKLGDLMKFDEGEIKIVGSIIGQDDSAFDIEAELASRVSGGRFVVGKKTATVSISRSPLSIGINLDRQGIIKPGDLLTYTLNYSNNTEIGFKDVIIVANLDGVMFDLSTVKTTGVLSGTSNEIMWNASRVPGLKSLNPGNVGSVSFKVGVRQDYPIVNSDSKNFELKISAEIGSPTVPRFVAADRTIGLSQIISKVEGRTDLDTQVYYYDSSISNSGPLPPRVGQTTTYTIHWVVKNFSSDVENVKINAFLGPNVSYTGRAKSTTGVLPTYNDRTQEVSWEILKIPATKGVVSSPVEATFQVQLIPSISQAGDRAVLINGSNLTAKDLFADVILSDVAPKISTDLPHDPQITVQQKNVTE